jgi:Family of unknown function (DUF6516)
MRYPAAEKLEGIRLVEQSHLPVRRSLVRLGIPPATFYRVLAPVRGSKHKFKYSLFFGREGERLVAYDNQAGKGDHRHYGDCEEPYAFRDVDQLIADFEADIQRLRGEA